MIPLGRLAGPVIDVAETISTHGVGELLALPGVLTTAPVASAVVLRGLDGEARVAVLSATGPGGCSVVLGPVVDRAELHAHGLAWAAHPATDAVLVCP